MKYYNPAKLMNMMDINGNRPYIYICTTNRNAGKSFSFIDYIIKEWTGYSRLTTFIFRYNYELPGCSDTIYGDVQRTKYPDLKFTEKSISDIYYELYCNGVKCGYAIALNCKDSVIKRRGPALNDTTYIVFDEFQSEDGYIKNEVHKFQTWYTTIARGQGQLTRYVPVYMIGNLISIANPYYISMGVSNRIRPEMRFIRGDGWVLEQGFSEDAAKENSESGFNRAFQRTKYSRSLYEKGLYLEDNNSNILSVKLEQKNFLFTLISNDKTLGCWLFNPKDYGITDSGLSALYISESHDDSQNIKYANNRNVKSGETSIQTTFIKNTLLSYYKTGKIFYQNIEIKNIMKDELLKISQ